MEHEESSSVPQRTPAVWVVAFYLGFTGVSSLTFAWTLLNADDPELLAVVADNRALHLGLLAASGLATMAASISLLSMRRAAIPAYVASLLMSVAMTVGRYVEGQLPSEAGTILYAVVFGWLLSVGILVYLLQLNAAGRLR